MPTYDYRREDGTTFEMWQNINDDPIETCPETGQQVKRLISGGTGLVFKGSGFYITDYKKNQNKGDSDGSTKSNSSESGSDSTANQSQNGSNNGASKKTNTNTSSNSGSKDS